MFLIARLELHKVKRSSIEVKDLYDEIHEIMHTVGYHRILESNVDGKKIYQKLPDATYFKKGKDDELEETNRINAAIKAHWKNIGLLVSSSRRVAFVGLERSTKEKFDAERAQTLDELIEAMMQEDE